MKIVIKFIEDIFLQIKLDYEAILSFCWHEGNNRSWKSPNMFKCPRDRKNVSTQNLNECILYYEIYITSDFCFYVSVQCYMLQCYNAICYNVTMLYVAMLSIRLSNLFI